MLRISRRGYMYIVWHKNYEHNYKFVEKIRNNTNCNITWNTSIRGEARRGFKTATYNDCLLNSHKIPKFSDGYLSSEKKKFFSDMQSIKVILTILLSGSVVGKCPVNVLVQLPLVVEYALWRGWQQALIYVPDIEPGIHK